MSIQALDHYTINVADLDASVRFYEDVVGLKKGERPPVPIPGAWLYCGDRPVVHLVSETGRDSKGTGTMDHVAFRAIDLEVYTKRLSDGGYKFKERDIPTMDLHQVFLKDPDGVTIELNFWKEV